MSLSPTGRYRINVTGARGGLTTSDRAILNNSVLLARAYAVSDINSPIPGAVNSSDRGAKYWADDARLTRANFPNYFKGDKGDPGINGGVGSSSGFAALFAAASGMAIAAGITRIKFAGYAKTGVGGLDAVYDATVDAAYVAAHPRSSYIGADGKGYRIATDQGPLLVDQFGASGDVVTTGGDAQIPTGGTPFNDPFAAAVAAVTYQPISPNFQFAKKIAIGEAGYRATGTLDFKKNVNVEGEGTGYTVAAGGRSQIIFPADTTGVRVNSFDTLAGGADPATGDARKSAAGSRIAGVSLIGSGTDPSAHGFAPRVQYNLSDVVIERFPGNGIHDVAQTGTDPVTKGNTCGAVTTRVCVKNVGGHGLYTAGDNANATNHYSLQIASARYCGIYNRNQLGSQFWGAEIDGAGILDDGRCSYLGRDYELIDDTPGIGAATTPGTNDRIWYEVGVTGTFPAWSNAKTYVVSLMIFDGGGFSNYWGPYTEGHISHVPAPSAVWGGAIGCTRYSAHFYAAPNGPFRSHIGFGTRFSDANATLPTGGRWGSSIERDINSDVYAGLLDHLSYASNGGFNLDTTLEPGDAPAGRRHRIVVRSQGYGSEIEALTLKGNDATFGRTTSAEVLVRCLNGLALGNMDNPAVYRLMYGRIAIPSSGPVAQGEIAWNQMASAGGKAGWYVSTAGIAGSTAVIKPFAPIDA